MSDSYREAQMRDRIRRDVEKEWHKSRREYEREIADLETRYRVTREACQRAEAQNSGFFEAKAVAEARVLELERFLRSQARESSEDAMWETRLRWQMQEYCKQLRIPLTES